MDQIIINVGGQTFTTTVSTVRKHPDSRLTRILDGKEPGHKFHSGQVFFDRDWTLFKLILDYMRAGQITLPQDFSNYTGLAIEAEFYGLHALVHTCLSKSLHPRVELLEVRFSIQETHGFFRIFCSNHKSLEALASRISVFVERPGLKGNLPEQSSATPLSVQRPSHHDLVFHCGTDHLARDDFTARFVSIEPDERKLLNSTNVLGLLVDTLLKDGFRLISTRTISEEDKVECFTFERITHTQILLQNETPTREDVQTAETVPQTRNKAKKK
ncbi:putative potassium channel regulatory protein [Aplochiton taeniatus]